MLTIGCHLSASKGFYAMGKDSLKVGANTFQFFTRNPRGSKAKDIDTTDVEKLHMLMKENKFGSILAHAPYTMNLCAVDEQKRVFARDIMTSDLIKMEHLPCNLYNFHPGNHVGQGMKNGISRIVDILNEVLKSDQTTTVLLETMSGKGTEVGSRFEELQQIIEKVELSSKLGVCLDTCHVYDSGYDIVKDLDGVLREFDQVIGLNRLRAIHINDSKNPIASHKDRHETIGNGTIGLKTLKKIVKHEKLSHLPFFLETPNELSGYKTEIALLRSE